MAKLFIHRKVLAGFQRRALRRYPREYVESLWGLFNSDGSVSIIQFQPVAHEASTKAVFFDTQARDFGERDGPLTRLGIVHSHPRSFDASPSEYDWAQSQESKELVTGICSIARRKIRLRCCTKFYFAQALLETVARQP